MSERVNIYPNETEIIKDLIFNHKVPTLLVGEAGLGKSTTAVFAVEDHPYSTVNLSKQNDLVDLVGQYVLEKSMGDDGREEVTFVFKHGKVTDAAENGKVLILEELTMAEPTILSALHGLIETPAKLHTIEGDVEIHPDFRVIGTANPSWTNYQGVSELNYAFEDRWAHVQFGFPSFDKIEALMKPYEANLNRVDVQIDDLYDAAKSLFALYPRKITSYISLRGLQFFGKFAGTYSREDAFMMAYLNKVAPEDRPEIADIVDNHFPLAIDFDED